MWQHQRNDQCRHLSWKTSQTPWNHHSGEHRNLSRDKIRKDMEAEYKETFRGKTTISVKSSTMRYRNNTESQKVIFIYGDKEKKSSATGFITAYVLKGQLKKFGMVKALFTPSKSIMGSENAETKTSIMSAHAKFTKQHQVIYLYRMQVKNLQVIATKEDRIEVLEVEKAVNKFSASTTTLLDLLYAFFSKNKASTVGLGTFTDSLGYTVFFIHTHKSKVNNVYEALNILIQAQFRDEFFLQPFYKSLPSETIAYISMGKDKPSQREIFHRDSNCRFNIQQEFPALPSTKHKPKQTTKPSNNPSHPAKPKSKLTTSFANKAKHQSKQPSAPREPAKQKYESSIAPCAAASTSTYIQHTKDVASKDHGASVATPAAKVARVNRGS